MEGIQGVSTGVVCRRGGKENKCGEEKGGEGRHEHAQGEKTVEEGFSSMGPDVRRAEGGGGSERGDGVDDEAPFFVGLGAVDGEEEQ